MGDDSWGEDVKIHREPITGKLINRFVKPGRTRPDARRTRQLLRRSIIANKTLSDPDLLDYQEAEYEEAASSEPQPISAIQEKGGSQLQLINHYRRNVLEQAYQSFRLALAAAAVGLTFYIAAVTFLVLRQPESISITSLISGSLVELISAINFYLYGRASRQLASFHAYLDRTCRFLTSDDACERITDKELRDRTRSKLILAFMEMPSLAFDASETENSNGQLSHNSEKPV